MVIQPGVCYREGTPTPEDYDEAIKDLQAAKNQLESMGRGEFQPECAVCGDSGHTVRTCHHDPLQLARAFSTAHTKFALFVYTRLEETSEDIVSDEPMLACEWLMEFKNEYHGT